MFAISTTHFPPISNLRRLADYVTQSDIVALGLHPLFKSLSCIFTSSFYEQAFN